MFTVEKIQSLNELEIPVYQYVMSAAGLLQGILILVKIFADGAVKIGLNPERPAARGALV